MHHIQHTAIDTCNVEMDDLLAEIVHPDYIGINRQAHVTFQHM